ncbi:MAG: TraR/DksA family transcriptional regulator [Myxococcales bacterium]|nr:TraR/DksA family transcriptional regulator [Myxococcales bacterium]MCB9718141.1 TraR/DksA family transcriptional regulator [Myxococcales bacterium]
MVVHDLPGMDHLSAEQVAELRDRLRAEQDRLLTQQQSEDAEASPEQELGDVLDKATEEARRRTALRRRMHHDARLREVEAALSRMEQGSYGICEETDEPIPFARLRAEPTTRYTVEALELLEEERARGEVVARGTDDGEAY